MSQLTADLFSSTIPYNIKETAEVLFIDPNLVTSSETVVLCPDITFEFANGNGTPIDPAIFSYSDVTNEFSIYTTDSSKEDLYHLKLKAFYSGYDAINPSEALFEVQLIDTCKLATLDLS